MKYDRLYITLGDEPSGVYKSQVTDVCNFLNENLSANIGLLSLISVRNYFRNRKLIKKWYPSAVVIPMVPRLKNWRLNEWTVAFIIGWGKVKTVICRNPLATNLALKLRESKKVDFVIYDGRGAVAAEWSEYTLVKDKDLLSEISGLEQKAVLKSDYRIAVSSKLIDYWREYYNYNMELHEVIPCTLNYVITQKKSGSNSTKLRKKIKFRDNDIVIAYAGSTAAWQSFKLMRDFLSTILTTSLHYKVLFLSKENENNRKLKEQFPRQVFMAWVAPEDVPDYLSLCDYGLLLRDFSVTNKVSAPTKFAEYLAAGLSILISDNLGDYSTFVSNHRCGKIISNSINKDNIKLDKITKETKDKNRQLADKYFSKKSKIIINKYKHIIDKY